MVLVKNVMSKNVVTVEPTTSAFEASRQMKERGIGSLIVVDSRGKPVGIVTETDIIYKVVAEKKSHETSVKDIMTEDLKTIKMDETIEKASRVMAAHRIRRLVVTDEKRLAGILALKDIVKASKVNRESEYYPYYT